MIVVVGSGAESSIILAARHAGAPAWFGRSDDDERIARICVMMKGKPGMVFKEGYGWVLEGETILGSKSSQGPRARVGAGKPRGPFGPTTCPVGYTNTLALDGVRRGQS